MRGAIVPIPNTPSWRGAQLKEAQGQLYLLLITSNVLFAQFWNIPSKPQSPYTQFQVSFLYIYLDGKYNCLFIGTSKQNYKSTLLT